MTQELLEPEVFDQRYGWVDTILADLIAGN